MRDWRDWRVKGLLGGEREKEVKERMEKEYKRERRQYKKTIEYEWERLLETEMQGIY